MKALLVENSATILAMMRGYFQNLKIETNEAGSMEEVLNLLNINTYNLIVITNVLKDTNGIELIKKIREIELVQKRKNIPILFISQNDSLDNRVQAFEAGITEFISKPFTLQEFNDKVKLALNPENIFANKTILVAEDSEVSRQLIIRFIKSQGGNILEAANGKIAFEILKKNQEIIDLIITDLFMPEMDGIEFCKKVRLGLGLKTIPVIFLTGSNDTEHIVNVFKAGASDYIVKPFIKEEFTARVSSKLMKSDLIKNQNKNIQSLKKLNQIKDEFLQICSHDLKTPLQSIIGYSELLDTEVNLDGNARSYLKHIQVSGKFLLNLVEDILDYSNATLEEKLEKTPLFLDEIISAELNFLRVLVETKDIQLISEFSPPWKMKTYSNKMAIQRITQNLISNALKFTSPGGQIKVLLESSENSIILKISDSGIGMSQEKIKEILNSSASITTTGTNGEKGSGLGLNIVKKLIKKLDGTIDIQSELTKGTLFVISFPKYKP